MEAGGITVIDDSYNANPDSVRAAIDVLASCEPPTALVLGDMGEVGAQGPAFHREVGAYASSKKISSLLAMGEATKHAVEAFGKGARHFDSVDELVGSIDAKNILVKGSRFMKMERVVAALEFSTHEIGGFSQTDDAGHVFRAGAQAMLLAATQNPDPIQIRGIRRGRIIDHMVPAPAVQNRRALAGGLGYFGD